MVNRIYRAPNCSFGVFRPFETLSRSDTLSMCLSADSYITLFCIPIKRYDHANFSVRVDLAGNRVSVFLVYDIHVISR